MPNRTAKTRDTRDPHSTPLAVHCRGFTLMELATVMAVLLTLALLVLPTLGGVTEDAKEKVTRATLAALRSAILGTPDHPGFHSDLGEVPKFVTDLLVQPAVLPSG